MKPFYQIATYAINSEDRAHEFKNNRRYWCGYQSKHGDPILFCVTTIPVELGKSYYAVVNIYRRNATEDPHNEGVA